MKFSNNFDPLPFNEQVQQLTNIYEQWNDCERTVFIYALSKKLPCASLKFLSSTFDHHLKFGYGSTHQRINHYEEVANSISFLIKIINKYNSLPATHSSGNDKIDSAFDHEAPLDVKLLEDDTIGRYNSKEEILHDLLMYIPLLRPNNDEGKKAYMQFAPVLLEDTMKYNFPVEFVQQIISYLLIHPVVKTDDRKILSQWQRQLEDHISAAHFPAGVANSFNSFIPGENLSSFLSTTSSISSASSSSSASSTTWPTVSQPLQQLPSHGISLKPKEDIWDLKNFSSPQDFFDDINPKYPTPIGNKKTSASSASSGNSKPSYSSVFGTKDEHNISFSKNGKEVLDFDKDFPEIISAKNCGKSSNASSNDFLTVPNMFNDHLFTFSDGYGAWMNDDGNAIKTRRSNSLTTPTANNNFVTSSSAENLANLQNKPRSFSLTMESSRNPLMSSGSETRLDDFNKMNQFKYSIPNSHVGMGHIGVWLKSLRLHKYFWLFTNMSYEQMMDITEDYLENLGVTKGARHKLVICIQKLADRVPVLQQMEKELLEGSKPLKSYLDELTNIVVTPMKPINSVPNDEDVATHVMRVFDVVYQIVLSIKFLPSMDEDSLNAFMWLVDKSLHHDAFQQQAAHLKELKFRVQRIKMSFGGHKAHFAANKVNNNNNNKLRWQSKQPMKGQPSPCDNQSKIHRKNSLPFYGNNNNKNMNFNPPSNLLNYASGDKLNQYSMMQQHNSPHYGNQMQGRNSQNTLMPFSTAQQQQIRRNSSCGSDRSMSSQSFSQTLIQGERKNLSDSGLSASVNSSSTSTASDILNSQLESLCRQMTESAIL